MKKVLSSFVVFIFAFFVFSAATVSAKVITEEKGIVNIARTEVVDDDLFIGAQTVQIDGTVNGDVFIGAQIVIITGVINGNLHVGTNTLDLGGKIKGNVYAGAQNVLVKGASIGGSLLAGAATANIDNSSVIGGSVLVGAGSLSVDSRIGRSVYAGTGSLMIGSDTVIGKDLYYAADRDQTQTNISSDAKIGGNVYKSEYDAPQRPDAQAIKNQLPGILGGIRFGATLLSFAGALVVGYLYLKLSGRHLTETSAIVSGSFWKSMGIGFLVSIAFIPALIVLLITIIGIPLAGISLLMFFLYCTLAKFVVGLPLGDWISRKFNWKTTTYGTVVLGLLAIYVMRMIPGVNFISGLMVFWVGLGALTLKLFSKTS